MASQACDGPVFLLRPENARHEASAAPLRVLASFDVDWHVNVRVIKRRGATHDGCVVLDSIPSGIEAVLTPRLRKPSTVSSRRGMTADALGSNLIRQVARSSCHSKMRPGSCRWSVGSEFGSSSATSCFDRACWLCSVRGKAKENSAVSSLNAWRI